MAHRYEDYSPVPLENRPWLDRPDAAQAVERKRCAGEIGDEDAAWLQEWVRDGYVVFPGVLAAELAEAINVDVDAVLAANRHLPYDELKKKFENVYVHSKATQAALVLPAMLRRLNLIFGMRAIPYQTLNLPVSSQQAPHSDAILMTTHPAGFMAAVWYALEDVRPDCGPLVVYPGSHRLPYLSAREVGIPRGVSELECARIYDAHYYGMIRERTQRLGVAPKPFLAKRGDALVWHSNLLHGGQTVTRAGATRKSLIAHYFGASAEHYSDLFQRACVPPLSLPV